MDKTFVLRAMGWQNQLQKAFKGDHSFAIDDCAQRIFVNYQPPGNHGACSEIGDIPSLARKVVVLLGVNKYPTKSRVEDV